MSFGKLTLTLTTLVLGVACWVAPTAGATWIGSEGYPAELVSEQLAEMTLGSEAGTVKCTATTFGGSVPGLDKSVALKPTFTGCKAFGVAATVSANGCLFVVHPGSETGSKVFSGTMDVSCPVEKTIVITALGCEIRIGSQSGLSSLTLTDEETSPPRMAVAFGLSGVSYNVAKDEGLCPFIGTGVRTNGTVGGKTAVKGTSGAGSVGVFALADAAILCEAVEEECQQGGPILKLPFKVKATAPSAKIVLGGITVDCQDAKLELEVTGSRFNGDALALGLEWNFNVKNCKTANVANCTTVASEVPFITEFHPVAKGSGEWLGTLIRLKIVCGGEVICRYSKAKSAMTFTEGKPATIEAKATPLDREVIPGEAGCAAEAKLTTTLTVNDPKALRMDRN